MKKILIALAALLVLGYGFFEARKLLEGPQLTIESPRDGSATSSVLVILEGTAENISFLTINDRPGRTDEQGRFVEAFTPPPGYTVFTVAAIDRFGRRASKSVSFTVLNYCPIS
jgi:hypothetical protein